MLLFEVKNQMLKRVDAIEPATDSEQYLKAKFTINDADWNGKARTAFFRLGDEGYRTLLDSNNECVVPSEVLIRSESRYSRTQGSKIFVSLVGEYSTTRITTNEVCVVLNTSGYSNAETPKNPTESEYQQIITQYANNEAAINEAKAECETARADLVGVKNIFANAIKGNLSGAVVFADDVSPVEHNPVVKVHGKNLIPSTVYNMANWGLASGTSNNYVFPLDLLKDGSKYTVSAEILDNSIGYFYIEESANGFLTDTNHQIHMPNTSNMPYTFEKKKGHEYRLFWFDSSGHTLNDFATNIQLEEGDTATPYEPYVDPSTVTVRKYGKNLFGLSAREDILTYNKRPSQITKIDENNFVIQNTVADDWNGVSNIGIGSSQMLTIKFVAQRTDENSSVSELLVSDGAGTENRMSFSQQESREIVWTTPKPSKCVELKISPLSKFKITNIQIEVGSVATDFEAFKGMTEHTPSADGTVEGITSLSPNMTILTDTEGAIVECEYIKDTNKVIQKIADALNITI